MYKSEAQKRKFHELLAKGEISPETVAEFDQASLGKRLPERLLKEQARRKPKVREAKKVRTK